MKILNECERLANNVLLIDAKDSLKTMLVTGSTRREGTSTVAASLAYKLAKNSSSKVLLIDGNLRNPSLHEMFNITLDKGLSDMIYDAVSIDDAAAGTELANLSVIAGGKHVSNPAELFDSNNLGRIIEKLKKNFDYIIIDSPPVNTCTDVHILASQVDGVVFVVHAGKTRREAVLRGKEYLEMAHAKILGVVLNRKRHFIPNFLYNRL